MNRRKERNTLRENRQYLPSLYGGDQKLFPGRELKSVPGPKIQIAGRMNAANGFSLLEFGEKR